MFKIKGRDSLSVNNFPLNSLKVGFFKGKLSVMEIETTNQIASRAIYKEMVVRYGKPLLATALSATWFTESRKVLYKEQESGSAWILIESF
jgi:hypothetical protein